jgi:hypothetical protein
VEGRLCRHGTAMRIARSGTACRAPTKETATRKNDVARVSRASGIVVRRYVGTAVIFMCRLLADACATEKACYDFGLVVWRFLATVMRSFVAQPERATANPSDGP